MTTAVDEVSEEKVFQRTLVVKLCTKNSFNMRAFTSTIIRVWRLQNLVETQKLNNYLFLFGFSEKSDLKVVLKNGTWRVDHNLLVLKRVSREVKPSRLDMHFSSF